MEVVIAVLSLIWVVSLFSLQRIDRIIDEYYSGIAYYLSIHNGVIDRIQLEVITKLPKPGLDNFLSDIIQKPNNRKDIKLLKNSKIFLDRSKNVKKWLEITLICITLIVPAIYMIDFSNVSIVTFFDKDVLLFIALFAVATSSIIADRFLARLSDLNWPVKFNINST